ncbi:unnamed protein product [Albugo candida]|uniref:Uncharacterized protein n=1 Tax=Albugo candida TaxID=65357 RepID=A0A024GGD2_9STRA|nr:unnamed protein product [Albugo candida]|eukprot:CCI45907.1 unnamed protein product [Albugo candida]
MTTKVQVQESIRTLYYSDSYSGHDPSSQCLKSFYITPECRVQCEIQIYTTQAILQKTQACIINKSEETIPSARCSRHRETRCNSAIAKKTVQYLLDQVNTQRYVLFWKIDINNEIICMCWYQIVDGIIGDLVYLAEKKADQKFPAQSIRHQQGVTIEARQNHGKSK